MRKALVLILWPLFLSCAHSPVTGNDLACRGPEVDGKKQGLWLCENKKGVLVVKTNYLGGLKDGPMELFFEDGGKDSYSEWQNGVFHGEFRSYRRDGTLEIETAYRNGLIHGVLTEWTRDGKKIFEGHYQDGMRHGQLLEWNEKGELTVDEFYQNDRLIQK